MTDLRSMCADLGWSEVQTHIQSGNVIFRASMAAGALERRLEEAIERRTGLSLTVIVRSADEWAAYVGSNPFPHESVREPNLVMLALSKRPPVPGAIDALRQRLAQGEQIAQVGDALWVHFGAAVAGSRLSPGLTDRLVGSPVTTRNWRTVLKLNDLASGRTSRDSGRAV